MSEIDRYSPLLNQMYYDWANKSGIVSVYEHRRLGTGYSDFDYLDYVRCIVKSRISDMVSFLNDKDEAIQTRRLKMEADTLKLLSKHKSLLEDMIEAMDEIRKKFLVDTYYD